MKSKKLRNITFDSKFIYAEDERGHKLKQSLLWYPALANATEEQRNNYTTGFTGFHWRDLDEDISFESFEYDDAYRRDCRSSSSFTRKSMWQSLPRE